MVANQTSQQVSSTQNQNIEEPKDEAKETSKNTHKKPPTLPHHNQKIFEGGLIAGYGHCKLALNHFGDVQVQDSLIAKDGIKNIDKSLPGYVTYLHGRRQDLEGSSWVVGALARNASCTVVRNNDEIGNKADLILENLLGSLSYYPYRKDWELHLAISCQEVENFKNDIIKNLSTYDEATGRHKPHTIELFGDKQSQVTINVLTVVKESQSIALLLNMSKDKYLSVIDCGFNTTLYVRSLGTKNVVHQPFYNTGVSALIKSLDCDPRLAAKHEIDGQLLDLRGNVSDLELINTFKRGVSKVKSGDSVTEKMYYGSTKLDILPVYKEAFDRWFKVDLKPAIKLAAANKQSANSDRVLIVGGGARLPLMDVYAKKLGFDVSKTGQIDDVRGLLALAKALYARKA